MKGPGEEASDPFPMANPDLSDPAPPPSPRGTPVRRDLFPWVSTGLILVTVAALGIAFWPRAREGSLPPESPTVASGSSGNRVVSSDPTVSQGRSDADLRGRHVYLQHCAACHGRWGDGRGEMALGMRPRPRNFTMGIFKFHSTPAGFLPTSEDLRHTIRNGIANSSMPAFSQLSEDEITAVIGYLKTLSPRWKDPANSMTSVVREPAPEWMRDPVASLPHVTAGNVIFVTYCAPCHGTAGDGKGPASATLEDIGGQPCPASDLRSSVYKSGTEPEQVFRTLDTGLDGTPMPEFHTVMSTEQRWNLVAFLETLRKAPPISVPNDGN